MVASGFVILSLLALLIVPRWIEGESQRARGEIESAADPARTLVTEIQYALARQTSALRGFLLVGDSGQIRRFEQYAEREHGAYEQLRPLARQLGGETLAHLRELEHLSEQWHEAVRHELAAGPASALAMGELPFDQDLYLEALAAATEVDNAILRATVERRAAVLAARRRSEGVQAGLAAIAIAAALVAAGLGSRVHSLAAEAEARRRETERALADTARAVESKARLIRGVTHDLKNPLGAALAYGDILTLGIRGELGEPQAEIVGGIRRSIRDALAILQDLLDLSQAESGALGITRDLTSLSRLAAEVAEDYRGAARTARQTLELRLPEQVVVASTDGTRVRQVLGNLVSNAIKYTPAGGRIEVEVVPEREGTAPRPGRWAGIRVRDDGPGIAAEDRERIFEEFERLPGSLAGGHGLGLAISRRVARLLDGEVTVDSEPGRGSTFTLWLPAHGEEGPAGA